MPRRDDPEEEDDQQEERDLSEGLFHRFAFLERLTRVGPGTPCGELMRRYWIPVAALSQLDDNPVRKVRVLGVIESTRARAAPDVPTVAQAGLPGYAVPDTWLGFLGPWEVGPVDDRFRVIADTPGKRCRRRLVAYATEPDEEVEEGWTELVRLRAEGKVRWIGVSNFSVGQLERARAIAPVTSLQPPYSLLRREIEAEIVKMKLR